MREPMSAQQVALANACELVSTREALAAEQDRNRELARRTEALQALVDAAEKLVTKWRHDADVIPDIEATADVEYVIRRAADELDASLTAPPSSAPTDPGRADTGREET